MRLKDWVAANFIEDKMFWKFDAESQFKFIYQLSDLVTRSFSYEDYLKTSSPMVISSHRSKSIILPVYQIHHPEITFTLRNNFHDWKLSVESKNPIVANFEGLFYTSPPIDPSYTGEPLDPVYFEGFPEDLVFRYYSKNNTKFSASIADDYRLYTVIFLCLQSVGIIKPFQWPVKSK